MGSEIQEINLSTGGLSFNEDHEIEPGSMMRLKLVLLPDKIGVSSYAKVVKCAQRGDGYP